MNNAWIDALDRGRARWKTADAAERAAITAELDAVWETLSDAEKADAQELVPSADRVEADAQEVDCAPRFGHAQSLLTWDPLWLVRAFGAH